MLSDSELYQQILGKSNEIIWADDANEAQKGIDAIKKLVAAKKYQEMNPELSKNFQNIVEKLKWIALPLLKKEEVLDMVENHFGAAFEIEDFDIVEKFRLFLMGIILFEERDSFKNEIRSELNFNKTLITSGRLADNKEPSIENWLKNYVSYLGVGPADSIKLRQFYIDNKDFNSLNEAEKTQVTKLFELYEKLKYSSTSALGIEEVIPVTTPDFKGFLNYGKLEKADEKIPSNLEKLFNIVSGVLSGGGKTMPVQPTNEQAQTPDKNLQTKQTEMMAVDNLQASVPEVQLQPQTALTGIPSLNPDQIKIDELKKTADAFPVGSLERRAIEQEIANLNK